MPSLHSKLDAEQKLQIILTALDDKKALDIDVLSIEGKTLIADYFVVSHTTSTVHLRAVSDGVEEAMETEGNQRARKEGTGDANWILLDYGDVVVHIFLEEARRIYDLESLWRSTQASREASGEDVGDEEDDEEFDGELEDLDEDESEVDFIEDEEDEKE